MSGTSPDAPGRSVLLTVAYDGGEFAGFAPQRETRTVSSELLAALRTIDDGVQSIRGASRTDAGVHARGQRVAFDPSRKRPLSAWVLGVVQHLPDSITVRRAASVPRGFAPRFAAEWKRYRYLILTDGARDPFWVGRAWRVPDLRDPAAVARLEAEATLAIGTHDFCAFRSARDARTDTVRTLLDVSLSRDPGTPHLLRVDVRGKSFMHKMVRILVGTLVDVARGHIEPGAIQRAIASRDRRDGGVTAPAEGLYLEEMALDVPEDDVFAP